MPLKFNKSRQQLISELEDQSKRIRELEARLDDSVRVEESLREKYRTSLQVLDKVRDGYYRSDADGLIIGASPASLRILGYDFESEVLGKKVETVFADPSARFKLLKKMTNDGFVEEYEIDLLRKDGEKVSVSANCYLRKDDSGNFLGVEAVILDVTESKKIKDRAERNEERFRLAMEASSDGIWDWDAVSNEVFLSPRCFSMLGYERDDLDQDFETWKSLMKPKESRRVLRQVRSNLKQGEPFSVEFRIKNKDGQWQWLISRGQVAERDKEGRAVRVVGMFSDIHEHKILYDHLRQQFDELMALNGLGTVVTRMMSLDDVAQAALHTISTVLGPDYAILLLADGENLVSQGIQSNLDVLDGGTQQICSVGECLCGLAFRSGQTVYSTDVNNDPRCNLEDCKRIGIRSFAALPLVSGNETLGILGLGSKGMRNFAERGSFLQSAASVVTVGLANAQMHEDLKEHAENLEDRVRERTFILNTFLRAVEHVSTSIVITDADGTITYANPFFKELTGYGSEEVMGQNPRVLKSGLHDAEFYKNMWSVLTDKKTWRGEICNRKKDGGLYWEDATISPMLDESGKITNYVAVKEDITARKENEDRLIIANQAMHTALNGMLLADLTGRITYTNQSLRKMFGYEKGEMIGDMPEKFLSDPLFAEVILKGMETDGYVQDDVEMIRKDGSPFTVRMDAHQVRNSAGDPLCLMASFIDVTDSREAEKTIRESEARYRALFDENVMVMLLIDPETRIVVDANQAAVSYYGWTIDELKGMSLGKINILSPEEMAAEIKLVQSTKKRYFRFKHRLASGEIRDVEVFSGPVELEGKTYLYSHIVDATEKKRNEEEVSILTKAIENAATSVVITDANARILYVNPQFSITSGYTYDEVMGKSPSILKSGVHEDSFYKNMWDRISSGQTWKGELVNQRKDGMRYWVNLSISPMVDREGRILHYVAVQDDITEAKDLQRLKEDVDRIMRHDLKTPLNGIINFPEILEMQGNLSPDQLEYTRAITDAGRKMLRMIDSSLDIFKMETGRFRYRPSKVDALEVVRELAEHNGSGLSSKILEFRIVVDGQEPGPETEFNVQSNERLLYSMLSNLVSNAIEASPSEHEVLVEMTKGDPMEIKMKNSGAVPKDIRGHFFDKYKTHGKDTGTGLGTYSVKLMADSMNYHVDMETSDIDNTTTISIYMPR